MEVNNLLLSLLESDQPCMVGRFGSIEIKGILYGKYPKLLRPLRKVIFKRLIRNAGFFSCNDLEIIKFSKLMIEDMKILDVLGSWRKEEIFLSSYLINSKKVPLQQLEPYFSDCPWSKALKDKRVLVIHPFVDTITSQYENKRDKLFFNKEVLPPFKSLETIKAVQSIAGEKTNFDSWFSALDFMKSQINDKDFDVAIIGCGAYGFPLAAHVKRLGKKAIHMGGATQILFGIKGKRWEENEKFKCILNEHFVRPSQKDTPINANSIEGGCYW